MNKLSQKVSRVIAITAILLGGIGFIYSVFLIIIGQPWTVTYEGAVTGNLQFIPAYQAFIPLLASFLLVGGLIKRNLLFVWGGLLTLILFSIFFLFGVGGILIPVNIALLVLVITYSFLPKEPRSSS